MAQEVIYDAVIVGNGIAAKRFLFELSQNEQFKSWKIFQATGESTFPPCSLNTTGVVCLSGIERGVSALGDKLVDSYDEFLKFIEEYNPRGIHKGSQYFICKDENRESFIKRYKSEEQMKHELFKKSLCGKILDNYLVDAAEFLRWFDEMTILDKIAVDKIVTDFEVEDDYVMTSLGHEKIKSKRIFFFTSAYLPLFMKSSFEMKEVRNSKVVPGNYLEFKNINFGEENFVLTYKHCNLVYRSHNKSVQLGGTTNKDTLSAINYHELTDIYNEFSSLIDLPELKNGLIRTGLRHKGLKRTPYWGRLDGKDNVYGMFSLYKNGWTFPFLGVKELVREL